MQAKRSSYRLASATPCSKKSGEPRSASYARNLPERPPTGSRHPYATAAAMVGRDQHAEKEVADSRYLCRVAVCEERLVCVLESCSDDGMDCEGSAEQREREW